MRHRRTTALITAGLAVVSALTLSLPAGSAHAAVAAAADDPGPTVPADEAPDDGSDVVVDEPGSDVSFPPRPIVTHPPGFRCPPDTDYVIYKTANVRIRYKGVPKFKNGPGPLTMTVTRGYSGTATYSISAGAETELGAIFAKAKVKIDASISKANNTTSTNSTTLAVPRNKYGTLTYVNWGKKVYWRKYVTLGNCSEKVTSGIINFPTDSEGWYKEITSY